MDEVGALTVQDVLTVWLCDLPLKTTLKDALSGVTQLTGEENINQILRFHPPHASALTQSGECKGMLSLVGEKIIKAVASQYALLSFPVGDTFKLTNATRVLISNETFGTVLKQYTGPIFGEREMFTRFLALSLYGHGVRVACMLLLPVFRATLLANQYAIDLPAVLNSLVPCASFSRRNLGEKLEMLRGELEKRGVVVKRVVESGPCGWGGCERYTVEVLYGGELSRCEKGKVLSEFYHIVMEEAKKTIANTEVKKPRTVTFEPEHLKMWMHNLRFLLRLSDRYRDEFDDNTLQSIKQSAGWIPISEVQQLLEAQVTRSNRQQPPGRDWICELVKRHDLLGRFQVGTCDVEGSEFEGLQCARALYGHEGRNLLMKSVFDSFSTIRDPGGRPSTGWMRIDGKRMKLVSKDKGYSLHDSIPHVTIHSTESLHAFQWYRLKKPLEEQYDEKLSSRKPLYFAEFRLHDALNDDRMLVRELKGIGAVPPQWVVFTEHNRDDDHQRSTLVIPENYFTGKVAVLCTNAEDVATEGMIDTKDRQTPEDEELLIVYKTWLLSADTQNSGDSKDGEENLSPRHRLPAHHTSTGATSSDDKGTTSVGAHDCVVMDQAEQPSVPTADYMEMLLDEEKRKIELFENTNTYATFVAFPKYNLHGAQIQNRSKGIAAFKRWIQERGLKYSRWRTGENDQEETYEVRKPRNWSTEFVERIAGELGLTHMPDKTLLKWATTRECEDKEQNYEILEFIGDAIMDFIVVSDSFLLGEPWHKDVNTKLCCNEVLATLIPPGLSEELSRVYDEVHYKVKADMVESILGAVYQSGMGLDEVRKQLRRFFRWIPDIIMDVKNLCNSTVEALRAAERVCPYLHPNEEALDQLFKYDCESLIDEEFFSMFGCVDRKRFDARGASHYALTPFHRIQDKMFATHFTTGSCYSYRYVPSIDTPSIFNRVLSAFSAGSIAFVNELVTEDTHVTIDFDGASVHAHGALRLIWSWFIDKFPSKSSMFLLDCSGMSVVTNRLKYSYHIHFPQAVTTLSKSKSLVEELQSYVVKCVGAGSLLGDIVGFHWKEGEGNQEREAAVAGRVILCTKLLHQRLREAGGRVDAKFSAYMDLQSILALGRTCREIRHATLSYLCEKLHPKEPWGFVVMGWSRHPVGQTSEREPQFVLVRTLWASQQEKDYIGTLILFPTESLSDTTDETSSVWKAVVRKVKEKECKPKEFFLEVVKSSREQCIFSSAYWERVIDSSLHSSRKLRMYLNDKFDVKYGQEFRPLFLERLVNSSQEVRTVTPKESNVSRFVRSQEMKASAKDNGEEEYPVEVAHGSTLRLVSLRCPGYRDVYGKLWNAWSVGNNSDDTFVSIELGTPVDDLLPVFGAEYKEDEILSTEWTRFVEGAFGLQPSVETLGGGSSEQKTAALQPAYWIYDPKLGQANFCIAGEVAFFIRPCTCLLEGLTTQGGMKQMVQYIVPTVKLEDLPTREWMRSYPSNCFPLFLAPRKGSCFQPAGEPHPVVASNDGQTITVQAPVTAAAVTRVRSKVIEVTLNSSTQRPVDFEQLYKAMDDVFSGSYGPSLFVTSDMAIFSVLLDRFPCVVTPDYFKSSVSEDYTIHNGRTFHYIFIMDNACDHYQHTKVSTGLLELLDKEVGMILVTSATIQKFFRTNR
ncbi:T. brucei spp.-specific protein [Trypanosoma brucei gambiense DAL972]|uniref:T. brucei spp.-specific protein n=1 Tax=Trypanosoma brucei gambiense (strain MHOM/CI/86/DAL972) TaxID=679716 RepID=C9ZUZ6_TRYB9|nr:T. brucei spp.-specific protein [Trypanosoma brucei gambiense DAL972]CBH13234.1 T. brucei spp.-specific protein [Trypanosoma brucei gambiense DAL972]|eukprot:XP_011775511.1 T. brucei spp.-specific protein [Trypanosoma brucei gambiense DAL972]